MKEKLSHLKAIDYVVMSYQVIVLIILLFNLEKLASVEKDIAIHSVLFTLPFFVRQIKVDHPINRFVQLWLAYIIVPINFSQLPHIIPFIHLEDIDAVLIQLDLKLFGVHPTVFLESIHFPILTELLQYIYISFYLLPIILVYRLYNQKRVEDYEHFLFVFIFGFYLSYIGYFLFPSIGPRFTLQQFQSFPIEGIFLTQFLQNTLNSLEQINRDAFPSGHTMMTVLSLVYALRYDRKLGYVYILISALMLFATVYLRYHYVVDVIGGIVFLGIAILLAELILKSIGKRRDNSSDSWKTI